MRGTKSLLRKLDKLIEAIENDAPKAIQDAVHQAGDQAQTGFSTAEYKGNNDVTVNTTDGKNEWSIDASGTAVLFIEYGTGIKLRHDSEFGNFGLYPPGSWSASHAGYLTDPKKLKAHHGQWPYGGEWIDGNPSANVMYQTLRDLRSKAPVDAGNAVRKALKK